MFFEQLKKACQMRNTSVTAVTLQLNISKSNVTNWKNGTIPNGDVVIRLSELLDVTTDFLLKGTDEQSVFNNTISNSNNVEVNSIKNENTYNSAEKKELSEITQELINIFENLPYKERIKLMGIVYDFEEKYKNKRL